MQDYEAMVIVDARLEEGEIQKAVDRFVETVTGSGGEVTHIDRWGVRRFAYEIAHQNEGYYFIANFKAPQDAIEPLKRTIQISDEYVRGKIVKPGPAPVKKGSK
jgi:small subunit ribosomal protein S6